MPSCTLQLESHHKLETNWEPPEAHWSSGSITLPDSCGELALCQKFGILIPILFGLIRNVVSHQTYLQTAAVGYMVGTTRVKLISGLKINNALSVQKV